VAASNIEWTEATWNPIAGCTIVSPGCTNCYAMRMAARLQAMGMQKYAGTTRKSGRRRVWTGRINIDDEALSAPLRWRKPLRIFVNSMSDLFQEGINEQLIERIWNVMESAKWHTFQILTKRPERMRSIVERLPSPLLPNVWLGTSVERSDFAHRIDDLRHIPARIRFVSFEPLLGPIVDPDLSHIHWAIIGGESGPHARPIERSWVEDLKQSCERQGVAFFFKQWGGTRKKQTGRILGNRTWDEYPSTGSII
jgi:protein gp37